jgi:hypothetical protein
MPVLFVLQQAALDGAADGKDKGEGLAAENARLKVSVVKCMPGLLFNYLHPT